MKKNKNSIKKNVKRVENNKHKTITSLVLKLFTTNPKIKGDVMVKEVKKMFKDSEFKLTHYSWYKHKVKKGMYNLSDKTIAQIK